MSDDLYAYGRARDERLRAIVAKIEIEAAMRDGAAFRLAIDAVRAQGQVAKDALAEVPPDAMGEIAYHQAEVRVCRIIENFLQRIITQGEEAEASLHEDPLVRPQYE